MFASCRLAFTASQLWASPGVWRQLSTVSQIFAVHVQVGMHEELATVYLWTKKMCRSCANVSPMHVRRCWLIFLVKLRLILKMGIKNTREICLDPQRFECFVVISYWTEVMEITWTLAGCLEVPSSLPALWMMNLECLQNAQNQLLVVFCEW
jgi:hypothetical protein